ncbi:MAG: hypothetical protein FWD06_05990 [Oscillospiraceae bacterium]|nr:hypothetical protein [Oscillospiraceae bacterium]
MRKWISLVLAVMMVFALGAGLVGCGNSGIDERYGASSLEEWVRLYNLALENNNAEALILLELSGIVRYASGVSREDIEEEERERLRRAQRTVREVQSLTVHTIQEYIAWENLLLTSALYQPTLLTIEGVLSDLAAREQERHDFLSELFTIEDITTRFTRQNFTLHGLERLSRVLHPLVELGYYPIAPSIFVQINGRWFRA